MRKNEITITEEERQVAANELAQIVLSFNLMKKTGAEICINVTNYCSVRGDQKVLIERTGLSKSTVSKMNKVGKLFNKAIQKFGENSLAIVTDVNWSDVYKNADYYDALIDNAVNAEELNDLFESKNLIDVMEQEVEEPKEQVEEPKEQVEEPKEQVEETEETLEELEQEALETAEDTPFDRIMNMKSSIRGTLAMLEAVNDSYKKANMMAVIKSAITVLKEVYEM